MAKGNAVAAKKLRAAFTALSADLKTVLGEGGRGRPPAKPPGNRDRQRR
jgi:hypothetical protein